MVAPHDQAGLKPFNEAREATRVEVTKIEGGRLSAERQ
jgi:hypothetical protein